VPAVASGRQDLKRPAVSSVTTPAPRVTSWPAHQVRPARSATGPGHWKSRPDGPRPYVPLACPLCRLVHRGELAGRLAELVREAASARGCSGPVPRVSAWRGAGPLRPDFGLTRDLLPALGDVPHRPRTGDVRRRHAAASGPSRAPSAGPGEGLPQVRCRAHCHQPVDRPAPALARLGEQHRSPTWYRLEFGPVSVRRAGGVRVRPLLPGPTGIPCPGGCGGGSRGRRRAASWCARL